MIKKSPIQKPFYFDTKEGIDHFTKTLKEENPHQMSPKDNAELDKLNLDMKKAALKHHNSQIKKWDGIDVKTYPSHPKQRGHLLAASSLETDIQKNNINHNPKYNKKSRTGNPSGRDYWKEFVANGGKKLPEVSPEDKNQLSHSDVWKGIYDSMSPFEKGTWNAEQRKQKLENEKKEYEFDPNKMAKEVMDHTITVDKGHDQRSNNYEDNILRTPPMKPEPGLSHSFTHDKLREGKILKEILDD